jgi:anaerobic selenocysteine-containing dehydrogenase
MLDLMTGVNTSTTTVNEICNCRTLVLWGANLNELYPPYTRWLDQARNLGVEIIYIDPRRTRTSLWCSRQLFPLPGADGAMAIGAIRHILESGSYDPALAAALIPDLELLRQDAAPYTLEQVSALTGVPVPNLLSFYRALALSERTIVWMGGSLSRYTNGIQSLRAIMLMQGLRNNLAGPGKGLLTMEGGKPEGEKEFVDHVCGPNASPKMNFRRLLNTMKKGNLDVLFLNSSYRRYPDSKGVREALAKVPFIVHRGFFMTEETEVAHLVVPATFSPESQGSHFGAEKQVVWRDKAVDAPGSCVPDWQFYRDIGRRIAPDRYPAFEQPEDLYRQFVSVVPSWRGITLERLRRAEGGVVWPLFHEGDAERLGTLFVDGKLLTPDGAMPVNDSVFGRITWDHPKGSPRGAEPDPGYPLVFMQGKVLTHWQQTLTNFSEALAQFSNGRYVNIHPETAAKLGLAQGDRVAIETATGGVEARVEIVDTIIPGIIFTPSHFTRTSPFPQNRSEHINTIVPNYWDRISSQTNGVGCTLKKL